MTPCQDEPDELARQDLGHQEIRIRAHEADHLIGASVDALEGAAAFIDKCVPKWAGR